MLRFVRVNECRQYIEFVLIRGAGGGVHQGFDLLQRRLIVMFVANRSDFHSKPL